MLLTAFSLTIFTILPFIPIPVKAGGDTAGAFVVTPGLYQAQASVCQGISSSWQNLLAEEPITARFD